MSVLTSEDEALFWLQVIYIIKKNLKGISKLDKFLLFLNGFSCLYS